MSPCSTSPNAQQQQASCAPLFPSDSGRTDRRKRSRCAFVACKLSTRPHSSSGSTLCLLAAAVLDEFNNSSSKEPQRCMQADTRGGRILNGFGGRLFNEVRSREGLAYSVSGSFSPGLDHPGTFSVRGDTQFPGKFITAVQRVLGGASAYLRTPGTTVKPALSSRDSATPAAHLHALHSFCPPWHVRLVNSSMLRSICNLHPLRLPSQA